MNKFPIIAIVGRPNVGKSTLFNKIIRQRLAIMSDTPGTTRDRIYKKAEFNELKGILVDTGGLEYNEKENIEKDIKSQALLAIQDADLILFIIDAKEGLTLEDHEAVKILRKTNKPILLIANKIDHKNAQNEMTEILKLGLGTPIEISAYHSKNLQTVINQTETELKKLGYSVETQDQEEENQDEIIDIAFIGKPNVGKSSTVNALLGKEKVIVSDIPGTTRDATDTQITWNNQQFNLIDTAGLRRRGKIERGLEKLSSFKSINAIERSDVVCLIIDYTQGIKKQDLHISSYALEAGKGIIIIINKTDLMENREIDEKRIIRTLRYKFDFLPWAPIIFTSALRRKNIEKILELTMEINKERHKRIPDENLQEFMKEITYKHLPPNVGNKITTFYSLIQDAINPPSFVFTISEIRNLHFSYRRYLENEIRKKYGFNGTGIKLYFKTKTKRKRKPRKE